MGHVPKNYWITHPFKIANCNGFHFNAYPLGLQPNGTLRVFMMLYDLRSSMYIHYYDINMHADVDVQLLYMLFGLMDYLQPNLQYKHDCFNSGCNCFHNFPLIFTFLYFLHFDHSPLAYPGVTSFFSFFVVKMYNIFASCMEECDILIPYYNVNEIPCTYLMCLLFIHLQLICENELL